MLVGKFVPLRLRASEVKVRRGSGQGVSKKISPGCWEECSAASNPAFASSGLNRVRPCLAGQTGAFCRQTHTKTTGPCPSAGPGTQSLGLSLTLFHGDRQVATEHILHA